MTKLTAITSAFLISVMCLAACAADPSSANYAPYSDADARNSQFGGGGGGGGGM